MDFSTDTALGVIVKDPETLGGCPVFNGTRVPFQALLDYLEGGETLDECLPRKLKNSLPGHECASEQQNLTSLRISLVVVRAKSNRLRDIQPHASECLAQMQKITPGQLVRVG